ncbi:DnaA regulatory inactivator Hda [Pseudoxanthomonas sangjuensis]|uniref:DnaA regulatory inactivator Hda n=1 Tax=Pseudoxanthomonas sangjuensis TaxID=1503750 RepID=UPI00139166E5|nr:DnaA regulatory inactivator Hda [Pseudoxanthomonas sangjuensis]KAF1713178.1 DnaA regulatory inactivator Hda [Pseudoxanthomonas sangjuensis]
MPLALRYPPDQRFESYVAAPAGALARLRALAERPGADWLFLAGAGRTGKTHLALALCAAAEQAGRRAALLPLAAAAGRLREALDALDGNDVVALDGVERIAGDRDEEIALFDFHNRARSLGLGVLYTAQAAPDELALALPDLRSRLQQCARIALSPLDDAGRAEVLRDRAQRRGLVLEDAAIDWLLTRTDRDLGALVGLLDKLDRASLAAQRRGTVPFLRKVIETGT